MYIVDCTLYTKHRTLLNIVPRLGSDPSYEQIDELFHAITAPLAAQFADLVDHFELQLEIELGEQPNEQEMEEGQIGEQSKEQE